MKITLPNFTIWSLAVVVAVAAIVAGHRFLANSVGVFSLSENAQAAESQTAGAPRAGDSTEAAATEGQALVAKARRSLESQRSIAARLRQSVEMFSHRLVGSGIYLQLGEGADRLFRLEMKMHVGDSITSTQRICDGRFLWIRKNLPSGETLGRVDLKRVRDALVRSQTAGKASSSTSFEVCPAIGGFPKLLDSLTENFDFGMPQPSQLGEAPAWVVVGKWKKGRLAALLPEEHRAKTDGIDDLARLPSHIPHRVRLFLSRDENCLPYRIEYLGGETNDGGAGEGGAAVPRRALVTIELYDVQLGAVIDPLTFVYKPENLEVADLTDEYLKHLGLSE